MKKLVLLVLAVTSSCLSTYALPIQGNATQPATQAAKSAPTAVQTITLGNSVVALERGWKFHPGDSPWVDGAPLWAQPGYSDSGWVPMNLVPNAASVDLVKGSSGSMQGWTGRGYTHLSGYAWYRLRVRIANPTQPLRLKMPNDFDDAFQLYANGQYVGEFGRFSVHRVTIYTNQPVSFALPKPGPDGTLTLALRFYMSPATALYSPDVGGMHGPPTLGLASTVQLIQSEAWNRLLRAQASSFLVLFLYILTGPLALLAWLYNRRERVWLWLFLACAWYFARQLEILSATLTTAEVVARLQPMFYISLPLITMFWWHWFNLEEKRWIPRAAWLLTAAATLGDLVANSPILGWQLVPVISLHWWNDVGIMATLGIGLLQAVILIEGFRRDRVEALLAAMPVSIVIVHPFSNYLLVRFHVLLAIYPFGFRVGINDLIVMVTFTAVVLLSLRRFLKAQVRQSLEREAIHRDLEDAHELQQLVLVPEAVDSRNFTVEAEYHPAQKVGGDFFQTVSRPDGTLLVVIGDVSGKGVSAAMLVAVLVGTIRNQAEHSFDPQQMLTVLNRRMIGRSGGHFATCLAADISPDGTMRIANAGHLSPYRNGAELELDGALPLGLTPDAEYALQTIHLNSGDRLTFITDGVIEAQNEAKELFGFDRARSISTQTPNQIASAASTFGQEDDITVLGVAFASA